MPTNMYRGSKTWSYDYPEVIATEEGLRSPRMATIDLDYLPQNSDGQKIIKPGHFISLISLAAGSLGRIFPASRAIVATASGGNSIVVKDASVFRVGDTLRLGFTGASNLGTISAINLQTNTLTLSAVTSTALAIGGVVNALQGGDIANLLGLVVSAIDINKDNNDIAGYTSATVYLKRLQIWTPELESKFPEITAFRPVAVAEYP